ncbi:hypothetical protein D3C86_1552720 [compost metagenome]
MFGRLPYLKRIQRSGDIVHTHDGSATRHAGKGGGNAAGQPVADWPACGLADHGFTRQADQQWITGAAQAGQPAQQLKVLVAGLAKAEARVKHDTAGIDPGRAQLLRASPQE